MAKKLPMLEEFEQQKSNGCKCGGNCQCNKVNEAKKYKFKDLAKAWEYVYGEDMEDEYHGFYQEVTGKHRDKVTKDDVAMIWNKVYGEDIASEYDAFFNSLQENLNEANKLEEFNLIGEKSDKDIAHDILQDLLNEFDPWELDAMLPQEAEETVLSYGHKGAKAKKLQSCYTTMHIAEHSSLKLLKQMLMVPSLMMKMKEEKTCLLILKLRSINS